MRFSSLDEWLRWQEGLHPAAIELGLERSRAVLQRLGLKLECPVITVTGTNGKGSTVALLEAVLRAEGYRTGAYFSPHLFRYNERIRINGREAGDQAICDAFQRVDQARGDISLTYFEFGTLAALTLFADHEPDCLLLEVGLGGRLDAVNLLDPSVAIVTAVGLDHAEWLGREREAVGYEKAGIFRAGRPAVCGDPEPPESLLSQGEQLGAPLFRIGHEFGIETGEGQWTWRAGPTVRSGLPLPQAPGDAQLRNAAAALTALHCLRERLPVSGRAIREGLSSARLPGRFEVLPGTVPLILDVAHNPHAAAALRQQLAAAPHSGRTLAVWAMLADKDVEGVLDELTGVIDGWFVAGLDVPRAAEAERLARALQARGLPMAGCFPSVADALQAARERATSGDRILVFGSFYTVAAALEEPV